MSKLNGVVLAAAAAALFVAGTVATVSSPAEAAGVKCVGANACKGQSACKTATNACGGQNACKGKGFTETTKEECDAIEGATFEPMKS